MVFGACKHVIRRSANTKHQAAYKFTDCLHPDDGFCTKGETLGRKVTGIKMGGGTAVLVEKKDFFKSQLGLLQNRGMFNINTY